MTGFVRAIRWRGCEQRHGFEFAGIDQSLHPTSDAKAAYYSGSLSGCNRSRSCDNVSCRC